MRGEKPMFNKPAVCAVLLRRSVGAASIIMASWAAGGVATAQTTTQTATPSSTLGSAAGVTSSTAVPPVAPVANPCQRFKAGSVVQQPPALFSQNGVLSVKFSYQSTTDAAGRQLFCFMTPDGKENPTLHVNAGDTLNITVTNNTPFNPVGDTTELYNPPNCGDTTQLTQNPDNSNGMTGGSMNIHYHGTNTTPGCHGDNVVKTLVNPGDTFSYSLQFPTNEPPGLYWYHPHVHGLAEAAVQGGASGAIIVSGIENVQPLVSGLPERILIIRDQNLAADQNTDASAPSWDLSLNYVPVPYPSYTPATIQMKSDREEFWRVANASADTIIDLQLQFDGVAQPLLVVGLDGVPTGSQDGTRRGKIVKQTDIRIPPAGRAEFIVTGPSAKVRNARPC